MNVSYTIVFVAALGAMGCPSTSTHQDAALDKATEVAVDAAADAEVVACEAPRMRCGARCVDPQWNNANCGQCGRECDGNNVCLRGTCVRAQRCPMTCSDDLDCIPCTLQSDPQPLCCSGTSGGGTGRCGNFGGCRRPPE
jgi:hypothetical protein